MSAMAAIGRNQVNEAIARIEAAAASGEVAAAALRVQQGSEVVARGFGKARGPDEIFLLASITKPMAAAGVMKLVDQDLLSLADPVHRYIPEFRGGERERVTVRHLLTHTSGLPDMLPENTELRRKNAPLKAFVEGTCKTPLLFPPGTQVRYQSMGILLAAEIAERITRLPFRAFLAKELFTPLGMAHTALGLGKHRIADTAQCQVPMEDNWHWNSPYWRNLGAPWGGVHANTADVARLLAYFLNPTGRVLRPDTARQMITNQNAGLNKPWGIGWMLDPGAFGKQCSPATFGHWGSTGTVAWTDPAKSLICVLLTTRPADQSRAGLLGPVSDIVSGA